MLSANQTIVIRGAGDIATGVAKQLYCAGFHHIVMLETPYPLAVRRMVAFSEAVHLHECTVEGLTACHVTSQKDIATTWDAGHIPVLVDPNAFSLSKLAPEVFIDAIIAKKNIGTHKAQANLVIGLGPGFNAGNDVHVVIETMRGSTLGDIIYDGPALPNTGIPGVVGGETIARVCWADCEGVFTTSHDIGDPIEKGDVLGIVVNEKGEFPVISKLSGTVRGLLRHETRVKTRTKIGDIAPVGTCTSCNQISDKAKIIGDSVVSAIHAHLLTKESVVHTMPPSCFTTFAA